MREDPRFDDPRLTALLFGELSEADRGELEAELEEDPALDAELLSLLDVSVLAQEALADAEPRAVSPRAQILRVPDPPLEMQRTRTESLRVWGSFAAAAVLVLAVVVGINAGGAERSAEPEAGDATRETTAARGATPLDTETPVADQAEAPEPDPAPEPVVVAADSLEVTAPSLPEAEPETEEEAPPETASATSTSPAGADSDAEPATRRRRRGRRAQARAMGSALTRPARALPPALPPSAAANERPVADEALLDAFK